MRRVQQSAHREVDLISIQGVYGSKPGRNLTSRLLRRHGQHPCTYTYNFRGFTVVWTRQLIIRVGSRDYILPIADVLQSMTRTCTAIYNTQSNTARKSNGFNVGTEIGVFVVWVVKIDVLSVRGIGVDLISVQGSWLTWFVWRSNMTWFRVWTEIDMVFGSGACIIHLRLEWGSKSAWHQCWSRTYLCVVWGIEMDLVLVWRPKSTCFLCRGKNWPCFCVRVENYSFLVWAWKLTWSQSGGSNFNWFQCRH